MSQIIFLNGTSSSGKSSIGDLLHARLTFPSRMYFRLDDFLMKMPVHTLQDRTKLKAELPKLIRGFHACIGAYARSGVFGIVDHVLQEPDWLQDYKNSTAGIETSFVALHCPIEILEKRERERGDREIGLARKQIDRVHRGVSYAVEINTAANSPQECVEKIISGLGLLT